MRGATATYLRQTLGLAAAVWIGLGAAHAQQVDSAYSKIDLQTCPLVEQNEEEAGWSVWRCVGYQGRPLFVAEGDLRFFMWLDRQKSSESLAGQTLPPFNHVGSTVEWRLKSTGGNWRPFATILRYHTSYGDGKDGQVLVVSQLQPGNSCHIAYIDALTNKNANHMARDAADRFAGTFDCAQDEVRRIGEPGPSLGF